MKLYKRFKNKGHIAVSILAIFCSFVFCMQSYYLPADADEDIVISVVAHRGYSVLYPENTLSAFAGAYNAGAKAVEFDVRETKDGQIVVFHDDTLEKYTGDQSTVADYTYEELLQFDIGSWFSDDFAYERIPTLDQALDLLQASNMQIFLELKDIGENTDFVDRVYMTCDKYDMLDRIVFSSFNYSYLVEIKNLDLYQPIMVLASFGKSTLPETYPAEYYGVNMKTLTSKTIKAIHKAGAKVYSYTPDTKEKILLLQRMGVDGVITDYAAVAEQ